LVEDILSLKGAITGFPQMWLSNSIVKSLGNGETILFGMILSGIMA
jgi:hypothetical protein